MRRQGFHSKVCMRVVFLLGAPWWLHWLSNELLSLAQVMTSACPTHPGLFFTLPLTSPTLLMLLCAFLHSLSQKKKNVFLLEYALHWISYRSVIDGFGGECHTSDKLRIGSVFLIPLEEIYISHGHCWFHFLRSLVLSRSIKGLNLVLFPCNLGIKDHDLLLDSSARELNYVSHISNKGYLNCYYVWSL